MRLACGRSFGALEITANSERQRNRSMVSSAESEVGSTLRVKSAVSGCARTKVKRGGVLGCPFTVHPSPPSRAPMVAASSSGSTGDTAGE